MSIAIIIFLYNLKILIIIFLLIFLKYDQHPKKSSLLMIFIISLYSSWLLHKYSFLILIEDHFTRYYIYIFSYIQFMNSFFGLYYDSKDNYIEKNVCFNYRYHPKKFLNF